MQLSEHFSLEEMTVNKHGLENNPDVEQEANLTFLCHSVLEQIRAHFGKPIIVNSGFRSAEVNRLAGGATSSQHCEGMAADIEVPGVSNCDVWHYIVENLAFDQCIAELHNETNPSAGWVHVSIRSDGKNRKQPLSFLGNGKYVNGYKYA